MKYPHPCVRCGMCCLSEPCPNALKYPRVEPKKDCRFLWFEGDKAECQLVVDSEQIKKMFGIGDGCCIKARAINQETGIQVDFASLPMDFKIELARRKRGVR